MIDCSALSCLAWPNRVRTCCDRGKQFFITYYLILPSFLVDLLAAGIENLKNSMYRSVKVVFLTFIDYTITILSSLVLASPPIAPLSFLPVRSLIFSESLSGVVFFIVLATGRFLRASEKWMLYESSRNIALTIIYLSRV